MLGRPGSFLSPGIKGLIPSFKDQNPKLEGQVSPSHWHGVKTAQDLRQWRKYCMKLDGKIQKPTSKPGILDCEDLKNRKWHQSYPMPSNTHREMLTSALKTHLQPLSFPWGLPSTSTPAHNRVQRFSFSLPHLDFCDLTAACNLYLWLRFYRSLIV